MPTTGGGHRPEAELDRLSNILKSFNDQFGNIPWTDGDRVHRLITEEIPNRVAADRAYQNAKQNSDKQNARIEHDKALRRVMTALLQDDTELESSKSCATKRNSSPISRSSGEENESPMLDENTKRRPGSGVLSSERTISVTPR